MQEQPCREIHVRNVVLSRTIVLARLLLLPYVGLKAMPAIQRFVFAISAIALHYLSPVVVALVLCDFFLFFSHLTIFFFFSQLIFINMVHDSQLCERCGQVFFPALSCPTEHEITKALKALRIDQPIPQFLPFREQHGKRDLAAPKPVTLGTLRQLHESSVSCPLCMLVYDVIARDGKALLAPGCDDFTVRVNPDTYQGIVTNSPTDVGGKSDGSCFVLRRLSLIVESSDLQFERFFDHIAQPCRVGTMGSNDFPFALPTSYSDMYFAGRKRPLVVNLDWLKSWVELCNQEHGETCELSDDQSQDFS